jgi:hypothetical protein
LPVSEALGVFLGILGMDWLVDGYPQPLRAAVITLIAFIAMFLLLRLLQPKTDQTQVQVHRKSQNRRTG